MSKTSQFKTVCKVDCGYVTQLQLQESTAIYRRECPILKPIWGKNFASPTENRPKKAFFGDFLGKGAKFKFRFCNPKEAHPCMEAHLWRIILHYHPCEHSSNASLL